MNIKGKRYFVSWYPNKGETFTKPEQYALVALASLAEARQVVRNRLGLKALPQSRQWLPGEDEGQFGRPVLAVRETCRAGHPVVRDAAGLMIERIDANGAAASTPAADEEGQS